MEGMITKQASIATSSESASSVYGKNDYQASSHRSFLRTFKSYIWQERLPSRASIATSSGIYTMVYQSGGSSFTGISCKDQNRSKRELAEESFKVGEAFNKMINEIRVAPATNNKSRLTKYNKFNSRSRNKRGTSHKQGENQIMRVVAYRSVN
jgi:hypothetical protein